MACSSGGVLIEKFLETLQNDLKNLSIETRKKYPQIKESCEEGLVKLRNAVTNPQTSIFYVVSQVLYPLVQGCDTKDPKIVKICLGIIQKLIMQQTVDQKGSRYISDTLWNLKEAGIEEVKVLQTVTLLLTTNTVVHGDTLAKNLVLCLHLHSSKDPSIINAAGATVRQLVSLVFERVVSEDEYFRNKEPVKKEINLEELKVPGHSAPNTLRPCAADAFLMFQDLVQCINGDQTFWMVKLSNETCVTQTFGLELLESLLTTFSSVFYEHEEFIFLLKERVCALVIRLFSPNIKYRSSLPSSFQQAAPMDKPYFPVCVRLLRVVSVLVQRYHPLLVTECEIFLSLIIKFLDPDKPVWQRALALEVLHKLAVQPELMKSFCKCYDMKDHSTSIFRDIVNALGAYVQSLFVNPQLMGHLSSVHSSQGQPPALLAGMPIGPGVSPQPAFCSRGVWLPVVVTFTSGQAKSTFLDMLDKQEPPIIPDGYGISVAYACLLDIVRSVAIIIQGIPNIGDAGGIASYSLAEKGASDLNTQLINSSWCGLLAALSPLIEASTDESACENILKAIQTFASLCGCLGLQIPRDAFITAICKASLPPHYALTILNATSHTTALKNHSRSGSQDLSMQYNNSGCYNESEFRQVVVVGTPMPTTALPIGAQQGPVMLTAKNLQCMRALLSLAHCHGGILGSAWHLVLTTLNHLVWILGLKPATGGSLKASLGPTDSNAVITTAVMADLPVLSAMLSHLFESSQYLDDVSLHHLINALCKLSNEAMELAYSNREPSLFAVAKLLETGLVNLSRVEVFWRPLTNHLLDVCQHAHLRMRQWGVEAVTYLVKAALQYKYQPPLKENLKLQTILLSPLSELSSVPHTDVRETQLQCVLQILHSAGETLFHAWPLVLGIIGAVSDHQGVNLVRIAFQCLQLVITDFLPVIPWMCLPLCVETAAKFGQTQELNISLTAVGLMWNISDFFYQNREKLSQSLTGDITVFPDFPGTINMTPFDKLWMCLYVRLADLCVDSRPAVRKSAGQTLFPTISAHGSLLEQQTWQSVLWQVLFPLLERVQSLSNLASNEKVDTSGNILIHHTRNSEKKQWAETQVLTLSGVARIFSTKRQLLEMLGDFPKSWAVLLEFLENAALNKNNEVSLAALKAFQEVLYLNKTGESTSISASEEVIVWDTAWRVWLHIGTESTAPPSASILKKKEEEIYIPSQSFLTALVQIFPSIFQHIKKRFSSSDLHQLFDVLRGAILVPIHGEAAPFILHAVNDGDLTHLQDGVLHCMQLLEKEALSQESNDSRALVTPVFNQLLEFSTFSCKVPPYGNLERKNLSQIRVTSSDIISVNYVPFGEKSLTMAVNLYQTTANDTNVIHDHILLKILQALHVPLSMKYNCPSSGTWKLAVTSLLTVLQTGFPIARKNPQHFSDMWTQLADTLQDFLFPKSMPLDQCPEEIQSDEAVDCQMIELLRDEVLPHSCTIPKDFVLKVVVLLNRGSIHSANPSLHSARSEADHKLREEFAKTCFETLLQFSLLDGVEENSVTTIEGGLAGRLAVTALLHRFQEVLREYVEDERHSGECPLPRYRLSEISFVLKAIATLIASLKNAPADKVEKSTWEQLIGLYPYLVDCTTTSCAQVSQSLRGALLQYCDLLHPPTTFSNGMS